VTLPRLILLNGPPAVGKSTIAARYVEDHPMALNLDVDTVRSLLGGWIDDQPESGRLARLLAVAMATAHLREGKDVVVPQLIARPPFAEALASLAAAAPAAFHEIVLVADREEVLQRLSARHATPSEPGRFNPRDLVATNGGAVGAGLLHDRLMAFVASRPGAQMVRSVRDRPEQTYDEVLALLDGRDADRAGAQDSSNSASMSSTRGSVEEPTQTAT
jgi:predicted kinase